MKISLQLCILGLVLFSIAKAEDKKSEDKKAEDQKKQIANDADDEDELKKEAAHYPYQYAIPPPRIASSFGSPPIRPIPPPPPPPPPPPHPPSRHGSDIHSPSHHRSDLHLLHHPPSHHGSNLHLSPHPPSHHGSDLHSPPHPPPPLPNDYDYELFHKKNPIPGIPGKDYPVYNKVPYTGFDCNGGKFPGFYADVKTGCQVWHYCQLDGRHDSFLCPNGTVFNQKVRVCDWWYNVDCPGSPYKYGVNADLYRTPPKKLVVHVPSPVDSSQPLRKGIFRYPPVTSPYYQKSRSLIALPVYRPPIARVPLKPAPHARGYKPIYHEETRVRPVPVYRSKYVRPAL